MNKHKQLYNLEASILWKDTPIVDFKVEDGHTVYIHPYPENEQYYPIEFRGTQGISMNEINLFVEARIVPRERYNIVDLLQGMGLSEYKWEAILRYVHGLCTDDCYWFKFPGDTYTYNDVKIRD